MREMHYEGCSINNDGRYDIKSCLKPPIIDEYYSTRTSWLYESNTKNPEPVIKIIEPIVEPIVITVNDSYNENIELENVVIENVAFINKPVKYPLLDLKKTNMRFEEAFGCQSLIEPLNVNKLRHIINEWDDYKKYIIEPSSDPQYQPLKQLKEYYKRCLSDNTVLSSYNKAKTSINVGRWYVNTYGLQTIPLTCKNALCEGKYIDIDISNCHPVILETICSNYSIECPLLSNYNKNRDTVITELMNKLKYTKQKAKVAIIACLNGSVKKLKISWWDNFIEEFKNIHLIVSKLKDFSHIAKNVSCNYNVNAKITSKVINIYENNILETMFLLLEEKEIIKNKVAVLSFDGIMVEQSLYNTETITPIFLTELANSIYKKVGIKVDFVIKPIINTLVFPDNLNEDVVEMEDTYEKVKIDFEKHYFKLKDTANFGYMKSTEELAFFNQSQIISSNNNLKYSKYNKTTEKWDKKDFVPAWIKDENMLTYDRCEYDPSNKIKNIKNLFTGWEIDKIDPIPDEDVDGKISRIKYHIDKVICADNGGNPDFLYHWFANIVQRPNKKTQVILLLRGTAGAGKSIILEWFGESILGSKNASKPTSISCLFQQFSQDSTNKVFSLVDEINYADIIKDGGADKLKNLITSKRITSELKGQAKMLILNHINISTSSNNAVACPLPYDDRRWVVWEVSDKFVGNVEYFQLLGEELSDPLSQRAFYQYLMRIVIPHSSNGLQSIRPITDGYKELMRRNIKPFDRFLSSFIEKGLNKENPLEVIKIKASDIFIDYNNWCSRCYYKTDTTLTAFGSSMTFYITKGCVEKKTSNGIRYFINLKKTKDVMKSCKTFDDEFVGNKENDYESDTD